MRLFVLVALLFTLGIAPTHAQSLLYVDADAPDGGDGTSWTTAFNDLQDALAAARTNADTVEQIWVADGIYYPAEADGDPLVSFEMVDGVSLYGGFIGTETTLAERDLETNPPTILSGGDNFTALIILAEDVRVTIDGLTVTQGGARNSYKVGGLHVTGSHLTLRNLVVEENGVENRAARGGLYMESSTAEITDVLFRANEATSAGGGAHFKASNVVMRRVHFLSNRAEPNFGGGLFAQDSRITIYNSDFTGNRVFAVGGASGGAIYTQNSTLRIDSTHFIGNQAQATSIANGGAIYHHASSGEPPGIITNSLFYANRAFGDGGGGGAVYHRGADEADQLIIANSIFLGNSTSGYLGAPGGAVATFIFGRLILVNDVLIGNESDDFDQRDSDGAAAFGAVTLHNSIVWGNEEAPFLFSEGDSLTVSYSVVEGGYAGEKIIDADPLFVRMPSPGPDERWGTDDDDLGDLHLQEGSPAIDFGLAENLPGDLLDLDADDNDSEPLPLDYEGNSRIQGRRLDLGPYESPYTAAEDPWGDEEEPGDNEEPGDDDSIVPQYDVYPNPTRSQVTVDLVIAEPASFTITLYDALGRRVRKLHHGFMEAGSQTVAADELDVAAGIYFVVIESEAMREVVPVTIVP